MSWLRRARPRGTRPEIPQAVGGTQFTGPAQWGAIDLPNPSVTIVAGLPAASRAVNMISNAVASMAPLELWTPDGYVADKAPSIITRPNATFTTFDFIDMAVQQAIMHGNFIGLLADFDFDGWPQQIAPVPAGYAMVYYDQAGYLVYDIGGRVYSQDEVFHVRANCAPNVPMGVGVVTKFRRAIGQALDQQNFAADTYRSGSIPAGTIELDMPEVDEEQAQAVTSQWIENHSGGRAPAVLPNTMKFTPTTWTPEDMQFLQARQFTVGEIAHMFGLSPTDLDAAMAGTSTTYANIEQRQTQRITDSYSPWMSRFEQAFTDCIPGGNEAKFCVEKLLRTDSKTRADVDQLNIASGVTTADEARKRDGKRPLPKPKPAAVPVAGPPVVDNPATPDIHEKPASVKI